MPPSRSLLRSQLTLQKLFPCCWMADPSLVLHHRLESRDQHKLCNHSPLTLSQPHQAVWTFPQYEIKMS